MTDLEPRLWRRWRRDGWPRRCRRVLLLLSAGRRVVAWRGATKPDRRLEPLTVRVDERHERDTSAEHREREARDPIELNLGGGVEDAQRVQASEAWRLVIVVADREAGRDRRLAATFGRHT